jgi:Na+/H+ antiporter NhaD/arsenite permease-like protein
MTLIGAPLEFYLFGGVLAGVAVLHRRPLAVTLTGLAVILAYKFATGFTEGPGMSGFTAYLGGEWVTLAELFLLLTGFAVLSNHFELSEAPDAMPRLLPDNWTGGLVLLLIVAGLSVFLDNIAAAVIGGVMAKHVYKAKVSIGFLAAIVAAANAGGAGSVIGDTTTTLLWIGGISPLAVLPAFIASATALAIVGVFGALQQHRRQPITKHVAPGVRVQRGRLAIVGLMLLAILAANLFGNLFAPGLHHAVPLLGIALWGTILLTTPYRRPDWTVLRGASRGAVFLVALVACAALMPVHSLPDPSWRTTLVLGFVSAVFDNIPLTALALKQGGYDWATLAYAVGFGGSMVWFGSSAGVALSNSYPQARSVVAWLREGWFVPVAYLAGFFVMLATLGWRGTPLPGG